MLYIVIMTSKDKLKIGNKIELHPDDAESERTLDVFGVKQPVIFGEIVGILKDRYMINMYGLESIDVDGIRFNNYVHKESKRLKEQDNTRIRISECTYCSSKVVNVDNVRVCTACNMRDF